MRRKYLKGPHQGDQRLSRNIRQKLKKGGGSLPFVRDEYAEGGLYPLSPALQEEFAQAVESGAPSGSVVPYKLVGGFRETRDGPTRYSLEGVTERVGRCCDAVVLVGEEEKRSGQRWFRVPYPPSWTAKMSRRECAEKVARSCEDYGKEYVECGGVWYEAVPVD